MSNEHLWCKLHFYYCVDAPTFTKEPQDISTDPGKKVTLECEADGNPSPTYAWFKNGVEDDKVLLSQTTSYSFTLSEATVGSYTCRVTVKGYKEIRSSAKVFQYGPPKILSSSDNSVMAKIASDTILTCDSFAIPLPAKVNLHTNVDKMNICQGYCLEIQ